eukprot:15000566-Alexandrium_andersonii.AAC.1
MAGVCPFKSGGEQSARCLVAADPLRAFVRPPAGARLFKRWLLRAAPTTNGSTCKRGNGLSGASGTASAQR